MSELEWLIERLGVTPEEIKVLRSQEEKHTLPCHYPSVEYVLGARLNEQLNVQWAGLIDALNRVRRDKKTFIENDSLIKQVQVFIQTL